MLTLTNGLRPYLPQTCAGRSRPADDAQESQFLLAVALIFLVGCAAVVLHALAAVTM
jgi:hypothetical protein